MKKLIFILAIFGVTQVSAQKQYVPSIRTSQYDLKWYEKQKVKYADLVKKDRKSEEAWLNYYFAARGVMVLKHWDKTLSKELDEIVDDINTIIPNSIVNYTLKGFKTGSWDKSSIAIFEKAYAMNPEFETLYWDMIVAYEVWGYDDKRANICKKLASHNNYSTGLLKYHNNLIRSLDQGSIIITGGDNDTFPLWYLQDVHGIRKDVTVVNAHLMVISEYRNRLFKKLGVSIAESDRKNLDARCDKSEWQSGEREKVMTEILELFVRQKDHKVHFSNTMGKPEFLKPFEDKLYMIGLSSIYSNNKIERIALIRKNYEQVFQLDYIKAPFYTEIYEQLMVWTNQNYLPSAILLYHHYKTTGETNKLNQLKVVIEKIAEKSDRKIDILKQLN